MANIREWLKAKWARFKKWVYGILVALGIATAPLLYAEIVGFSYTPADQYEDGTAMPITDIAFTRLYCNDEMVANEPGADGDFSVEFTVGRYECYATHVVLGPDGQEIESAPSNLVVKIVNPARPNPPGDLTL